MIEQYAAAADFKLKQPRVNLKNLMKTVLVNSFLASTPAKNLDVNTIIIVCVNNCSLVLQ